MNAMSGQAANAMHHRVGKTCPFFNERIRPTLAEITP